MAQMLSSPKVVWTPAGLATRRARFQRRKAAAGEAPKEASSAVEVGEQCVPFLDRDGKPVQVMCCDYGFRSGVGRLYQEGYGEVPDNAWNLAVANFKHEWSALRKSFRQNDYKKIADKNPPKGPIGKAAYSLGGNVVKGLASFDETLESSDVLPSLDDLKSPTMDLAEEGEVPLTFEEVRKRLSELKLSNEAVWKREEKRVAAEGPVESPWYVRGPFTLLCIIIDMLYDNRPLPRFWFLEMVARMPYFSYMSILHLYESLGWWRAGADVRKVHFAEEWNELHHLQIMEALGGDQMWIDRFMAMHASIAYYWFLVIFYVVSPKLAYNFSELVEYHAYDTYVEFLETNEEVLKTLPPPYVAAQYYRGEDLYLFDDFQTSKPPVPRRPPCENLYDVFKNIGDDELEHVSTMQACQENAPVKGNKEKNPV